MNDPARKPAEQLVNIPCQIQSGPFPGEFLVSINIGEQVVSGFIRENFLTFPALQRTGSGFVRGTVVKESESQWRVQLPPGSYFTTANGMTSVSSQWAKAHLQFVAA